MTRKYLIVATALLLSSTASMAETTVLQTSGYWRTFYTKNENSRPQCGINTEMKSGRASFFIKYAVNDPGLYVHIFKEGWRLPQDASIPMTMVFSNGPTWNIKNSRGYMLKDGYGYIEFLVGDKSVEGFMEQFAGSSGMILSFTYGNEGYWHMPLEGSRAAIDSFKRCVIAIGLDAGSGSASTTQPIPENKTTQPFGNKTTQPQAQAQNTQPFGNMEPKWKLEVPTTKEAPPPQDSPPLKSDKPIAKDGNPFFLEKPVPDAVAKGDSI